MAVSGNQLTRLGAYLFGVGKKLVIAAKAPGPVSEKCNVDQATLLSDAPFDNTSLLGENADNTSLLTSIIDTSTLLSNNPYDNTTLLTSFVDSTTTLCKA